MLECKFVFGLLFVGLFVLLLWFVMVNVDEVEGLCIVIERKLCNLGWEDIVVLIIMVLCDVWGKESECELWVYIFERVDEGDKLLIVFELLVDVKGVVFLSFLNMLMFDD